MFLPHTSIAARSPHLERAFLGKVTPQVASERPSQERNRSTLSCFTSSVRLPGYRRTKVAQEQRKHMLRLCPSPSKSKQCGQSIRLPHFQVCCQHEPRLAWDERGKTVPRSGLVCIVYGNYCPAAFNPLMSYHTLSSQFLYNLLITACCSTKEEAERWSARPHYPSRAKGKRRAKKATTEEHQQVAIFRHTVVMYASNVQALKLGITQLIALQLFTSAPFIT